LSKTLVSGVIKVACRKLNVARQKTNSYFWNSHKLFHMPRIQTTTFVKRIYMCAWNRIVHWKKITMEWIFGRLKTTLRQEQRVWLRHTGVPNL